jgi:hypothetical protein
LLQHTPAIVVAIIVFSLIIGFYLLGHRIRNKALKRNPELAKSDLGPINGTLLGLLGLLLAFTFSMSSSRFDNRRNLVIEEANAIGTVVLRTEVYPDSMRKLLRADLKEYVEARVEFYKAHMNLGKAMEHYAQADRIGKKIWSMAASYARENTSITVASQLMPALNAMIDVTTTRLAAGQATVPDSIMYFLFILCLCSAFLLGYDTKGSVDWIIVIGFAIMLSSTVFNIIDLDRPRSGLIDLDSANEKIVELREMFAND